MEFDFFFKDAATTEIYTLSLHDALPISHMAKATNPLVHSFPLVELPMILGMCSRTTNKKNITPSIVAAGRAIILCDIPAAAAKNATPTKYAQNSSPGMNAGTRVATKTP